MSLTWVLWNGPNYAKWLILHGPQLTLMKLRATPWNWPMEQFTLWNMPRHCWGSQVICHVWVNGLKMACLMPHNLFTCSVNVGYRLNILTLEISCSVLMLECLWYQCAYNRTSWFLDWLITWKTWGKFFVLPFKVPCSSTVVLIKMFLWFS